MLVRRRVGWQTRKSHQLYECAAAVTKKALIRNLFTFDSLFKYRHSCPQSGNDLVVAVFAHCQMIRHRQIPAASTNRFWVNIWKVIKVQITQNNLFGAQAAAILLKREKRR